MGYGVVLVLVGAARTVLLKHAIKVADVHWHTYVYVMPRWCPGRTCFGACMSFDDWLCLQRKSPCWIRIGQAAGAVIEGEPRLFGLGPLVMRGFLVHVRVQGWLICMHVVCVRG